MYGKGGETFTACCTFIDRQMCVLGSFIPSTAQSEVRLSPTMSRMSIHENGTETEEDDGMVLVGRPT